MIIEIGKIKCLCGNQLNFSSSENIIYYMFFMFEKDYRSDERERTS